MKSFRECIAVTLFILFFIWVILPVSADCAVYENTVRLRVVADSDENEAQRVKLKVRDAVTEFAKIRLDGAENALEALEIFAENKTALEETANAVLKREGCDYKSSVVISKEVFPTRTYGDLRLPAGEYYSVRVILGRGEGKNWWCLLFPPLCLGAAEPERALSESGISSESSRVFTVDTPKYRLRFRLLEFFAFLGGAGE